ncbi:hypothetical protein EXIGLDRAFT_694277 [Exidia glandulosa HHB12029]|uniref:DUF6593 domain-containing protein n=1 Tax=Exidia glandulosa HHB12029 TaxID=1314781 RepID=A0A165GPF7_EXIGL|nr:hypothetical protein EXIGLDRAFT_694277 [Exidia glandulosa HHB12029]
MSRGAPAPPKPLVLELTTTSVRNVVFSTPGDSIYYEIASWKWTPNKTLIKKLDFASGELKVICEIERKKGQEPRMRWISDTASEEEQEPFTPASEFVSTDSPFSLQGKFRAANGKAYKWVVKSGHLELFDYDADPKQGKPLITYRKHRRYFGCGLMSRRPALIVQQEIKESLDTIIVSFLLMERLRRDRLIRLPKLK